MDRMLTAREVAGMLGVSVETALRWRRSGRLPGGYRLAAGVLRWRESDIDCWLEDLREDVDSNERSRGTVSSDSNAPPSKIVTDAG